MRRAGRRTTGFTLIETIIAGALFILIGGSVMVLGNTGSQVLITSDVMMASQTTARGALDRLGRDLRESSRGQLKCARTADCTGTPSNLRWTVCMVKDQPDPAGGTVDTQPEQDRVVRYHYRAGFGTIRRYEGPIGDPIPGWLEWPVIASGILGLGPDATRITCDAGTGRVEVFLTARTRSLVGQMGTDTAGPDPQRGDFSTHMTAWVRNP